MSEMCVQVRKWQRDWLLFDRTDFVPVVKLVQRWLGLTKNTHHYPAFIRPSVANKDSMAQTFEWRCCARWTTITRWSPPPIFFTCEKYRLVQKSPVCDIFNIAKCCCSEESTQQGNNGCKILWSIQFVSPSSSMRTAMWVRRVKVYEAVGQSKVEKFVGNSFLLRDTKMEWGLITKKSRLRWSHRVRLLWKNWPVWPNIPKHCLKQEGIFPFGNDFCGPVMGASFHEIKFFCSQNSKSMHVLVDFLGAFNGPASSASVTPK